MSFLKTNYDEIKDNEYAPLPTGDYEVIIDQVKQNATPSGAETIAFNLRVRSDLDRALSKTNGKFHNRIIFHNEWRSKKTGQFSNSNLQRYLKAVGAPDKQDYPSFDDYANALIGKAVKVHVKLEKNAYKKDGSMRNTIAAWDFKKTDFPLQSNNSGTQDPFADQADNAEITDADIPF